jgi:predicted RNA-binding Zn-ribbon protein involved in translation (DUF1610 family)
LDDFGKKLLTTMGYDPSYLPRDHNPITKALKESPSFILTYIGIPGYSMMAMSRVATTCQMVVYDANRGPERDGDPQALRRHWYAWYKVDFAQPYQVQIGEGKEFDGTAWAARLSETYADFVDNKNLTYQRMWVKDASRMMQRFDYRLFSNSNVLVCVEKDSLEDSFVAACKALGATALLSGKGKNSKAAMELLLRQYFGWSEDNDPFDYDHPLYVLVLSDHDFDGDAVIQPTFAEQARRYTRHIKEARIGVIPNQVPRERWEDAWYDAKVNNEGYISWAESKALFKAECASCGHEWLCQGTNQSCPSCGADVILTVKTQKYDGATAHGFEVEALETRKYYVAIVQALLSIMDFDFIVGKLRDECQADNWSAAASIQQTVLDNNDSYQGLLKEFDRLNQIKEEFENRVRNHFSDLGQPHVSDWRDLEDDPEPSAFEEHVLEANRYSNPWRPFSSRLRTEKLVEWITDEHSDDVVEFANEEISW